MVIKRVNIHPYTVEQLTCYKCQRENLLNIKALLETDKIYLKV